MINTKYLFDDIGAITCAWVRDDRNEETDLAAMVDFMGTNGIKTVSVPCGVVGKIWPWVEKQNIKIIGRFDFNSDNVDADVAMSNLATAINTEFKHGLTGAQIFVPLNQILQFVDEFLSVRDDLFFQRHLSIAIDVDNKVAPDWAVIFSAIKKLRADSLLLIAHGDDFDVKSDFVGRVFEMLNSWDAGCDLHMMFDNNLMRVSQVLRMVQKICPNLIPMLRVFRPLA